MANKNIDDEMSPIIAESRLLAIAWKHAFINYDHLFVSMLKIECMATPYLGIFAVNEWEEKVKSRYAGEGKPKLEGSVPLTLTAERVIKHAIFIANSNSQWPANTVHLLLAMMAFDNDVSEVFDKAGIAVEDVIISHYGKEIQLSPFIKIVRSSPFSKWEKFFLSSRGKRKEIDRIVKNAVNLYHYKLFNRSIIACQIGLDLSPKNLQLLSLLAYNNVKLFNYENALEILTELLKAKPGDKNSQLLLSHTYNATGKYVEAAEILDKLLAEEQDNTTYLNNRGFNLLRQERYADAAPYFEKAIQHDPLLAYPLNNLGFVKYKLGEEIAGIALIDKSLEQDRGNSYAYKNKGIIAKEQGNKDAALANFKLALKYGYAKDYGDEVKHLMEAVND
jgi:tetratricopeptide (TPR) repeat protein